LSTDAGEAEIVFQKNPDKMEDLNKKFKEQWLDSKNPMTQSAMTCSPSRMLSQSNKTPQRNRERSKSNPAARPT